MDKVIVAKNLSLSYSSDETIINEVDFSVNSGSFVFITGASGSGKSTLLKSLYGALSPQQGSLIVGGVELGNVSRNKLNFLRRHVGIVFQDYKLVRVDNREKYNASTSYKRLCKECSTKSSRETFKTC